MRADPGDREAVAIDADVLSGSNMIIGDMIIVEDTTKVIRAELDWDAIQLEWCTAVKSERQIAKEFKTHRSTIKTRANKEGWVKNLTERVKIEREKQLAIIAAKEKSLHEGAEGVVSSAAELQVTVVIRHRKDIADLAVIVEANLSELGAKIDEKFVIVLKDRVAFADTTAKTLRALTVMEREAHGIGADKESEVATHEGMMEWFKAKEV